MKINLLFLLFIIVSCGDSDFKKVELLDEFRVLAIEADKPEANAGDTVGLRLFISDAGNGAGRIISGTLETCTDPGVAYGALVNCNHDPQAVQTSISLDTTTPDFTNNDFIGFSTQQNIPIPTDYLDQKSSFEQFNGVPYLAIYKFDIDGKTHTYFKRIVVTSRVTLNSNPSSSAINVNGTLISSEPVNDDKLSLDSNDPEDYSIYNVDGTLENKKEKYLVAWYVNQGKFNLSKTYVNENTEISDLNSNDPLVLVAIIRDDRGGVEVLRQTFP